jgi:SM-20-related protein
VQYKWAIVWTWNCYWSGETVFFKNEWVNNPADQSFYDNEIIKSVLPRKNRMVLFEGNIVHSVRPLSKTYKDLRLTLMFKLKNISVDKLMENYRCN